jgi:hypothetical protein
MKSRNWRKRIVFLILVIFVLGVISVGTLYAATSVWPSFGATAIDKLRGIFGDRVVAVFEDAVLRTEDKARQITYQATGNSRGVGWVADMPVLPEVLPGNSGWMPQMVTSLANRKNEGQWLPFLSVKSQVAAYRTFVAPDPSRPYAFAAIIAFDLKSTRLHFLLGTEEPKSDVSLARPGRIPLDERKAGSLLAAFNGGFKAEHGYFGVMVDGKTVIPPVDGLGAVGLYTDGSVRIGLLEKDIPLTSQLIAWRQNGLLVIQGGQINPLTNSADPKDWGYVVSSGTATYRSALGISKDERTLYFIVGPDLTLPALAKALQATGIYQAIQLDINNYWAHFDSFKQTGSTLEPVALLDFMKGVDDQRFLGAYIRDYFYVTAQ